MSKRDDNWTENNHDLVSAAVTAGIDPGIMARIAGFESGYDAGARPVHRDPDKNRVRQFDGVMAMSSGYGYGQFLDGTWKAMINKYGERHGIANASRMTQEQVNAAEIRSSSVIQAAMLAEFTKENIDKGMALGGEDADANVYAFHNLGDGDARRFLNALAEDSSQRVDAVLSASVIRGNPGLYGDGSRSLDESYLAMTQHMSNYDEYAVQAIELIRELQHHLNELGIPDAKGHRLDPNGTFDQPTQQAVATFQRQLGLPDKSPVTAHTLRAAEFYAGAPEILRKPLQPALPSELPEMSREPVEHFPPGAPPQYRNDWLQRDAEGRPNFLHSHEPAMPHRAPAREVNPVQAQLLQLQRELDAAHEPQPPGTVSGMFELRQAYSRPADREPDPPAYRPQQEVQAFPAHHRDYALFEAIRRQLPPGTSDEMAAHVMMQAKACGIERASDLERVSIRNGHAFVIGTTPGDETKVSLTDPVPTIRDTLQQSAAFDQQQTMQLAQFQEQQREINAPGGGPTMRPPGGGFGMG